VSAEWKRGPPRRKDRKEGMEAEECGARREDRLGAVELCGRMLGLLQVRAVVRDWDRFCASKVGEVGFCSGKVGLGFFIFLWRGLQKSGPKCAPMQREAASGGGRCGYVDLMTELSEVKRPSIKLLYSDPTKPWKDPFIYGGNAR